VRSQRTWWQVGTRMGAAVLALAGVAAAVSACGGGPGATGVPGPSSAAKPPKRDGISGQITAENGSTWTVATKDGKQYTVTITPQTQFGTKRQPATAQQFPNGATVRVAGAVNGMTVTAKRVTAPQPKQTGGSQPASPAPTGAP
jgi:hypothetical protein